MARKSWKRVEGRHTTRNIKKGLQARVSDPLWMLSRQWQFGEFQGEDASDPVKVNIEYESLSLAELRERKNKSEWGKSFPIQKGQILESIVESSQVSLTPADFRISAEAGVQFLRKFSRENRALVLSVLQSRFPLTASDEINRDPKRLLIRSFIKKSFDARLFFSDSASTLQEIKSLGFISSAKVDEIFSSWSDYYQDRFVKSQGDHWKSDRMEYSFSLKTEEKNRVSMQLDAPEYFGQRLDWYSFNLNKEQSTYFKNKTGNTTKRTVIPTPVKYPGMPAKRFWNFEDGEVHFGGLSAERHEVAQLMLTEFATVYSNDWYMLPLTVDTGDLVRVIKCEVIDSFGQAHNIESTAERDGEQRKWKFFELSGDISPERGHSPWLFVPNTVLASEEGSPVEKVTFTRDEVSNLAWAIEEILEMPSGARLDRHGEWGGLKDQVLTYLGESEKELGDDEWVYRFIRTVPPYWVPFVREVIRGKATSQLIRSRLKEWDLLGDYKSQLAGGQGLILDSSRPQSFCDEEIPRGGVEVYRSYQFCRESSGKGLLWMARNKKPSSGNRSSGRETDYIERGEKS